MNDGSVQAASGSRSVCRFVGLILALAGCGDGSEAATGTTIVSSTSAATGTSSEPPTSDPTSVVASTGVTASTSSTGGEATTDWVTSTFCGPVDDPESPVFRDGDNRCIDCGEAFVPVQRVADLVLVVDKSASMVGEPWDADADPDTPEVTRWSSVHAVLSAFAASHENALALGLVLSPGTEATDSYDVAACQVADGPDAPLKAMDAASLIAALPPADAGAAQIAGATPHRAALLLAYEEIAASAADGTGSVVLISDGAANCSLEAVDEAARFEAYDLAIAGVAATARAAGITTYVIGLEVADLASPTVPDGEPDATNNHVRLGQLALAGGGATGDMLAPYYNSHNQDELAAAMTTILERVYPCVVQLAPVPVYPDFVEVFLGDVSVPRIDGPCEGGTPAWFYSDDTFSELTVCGALCDSLRSEGSVDLAYRCPHR